ncbi:serine/threonine-protein kinase 31 isoform X3 [Xenopus laevis]|uniref:Serine/threonine-protein kinase 31 isoform X3 n=1 Tax=Xenopus laevis TaxID=8355 RepID=A0A8J1KX80_XENLA|nr:serine/threonine-protein kinase 31 isoform X3 [Xenopus laevis]
MLESVYVSYVEDAVTFWGQAISRIHDISELSDKLDRTCPTMNPVFATPDPDKIYGGMFTADKCWYRCKLQKMLNDDQYLATYIDYGNSEVLNRSSIVELPDDLQFPAIGQKYRLWGLQLQECSKIEQGLKFLNQLIADKKVSVQQKVTNKDGTITGQVWHENIDVGEEVANKGFAEKCKHVSSPEVKKDPSVCALKTPSPWASRKLEKPPMREPKTLPVLNQNTINHKESNTWMEVNCRNGFTGARVRSPDVNFGNTKQDSRLLEEIKLLKNERDSLIGKSSRLESQINKLQIDLQKEKEVSEETIHDLEGNLQSAVGNKLKSLASKIEILRSVRRENANVHSEDDLLQAVIVVTEDKLVSPSSLSNLDETWAKYNLAQETIKYCSDVTKLSLLINGRDNVQQELLSAVDCFILEVDELPLDARATDLEALLLALESVYGAPCDRKETDAVFDDFHKWKQAKMEQFTCVRNDTDNSLGTLSSWFCSIKEFFDLSLETSLESSEVVGNIDETLDQIESHVSKELDVSLVEHDKADRQIIIHAYNRVVQCIHEELHLISLLASKYSTSTEFKKSIVEWIHRSPNINQLMSVKKTIKGLKSQLRWKLVERSSMEDSEESNETILAELKEEIRMLRNTIFSEIFREQEEYRTLSSLVQKWFPELPLIHPEAGILNYMNSGGLLSGSVERDLFDAEPMKELSSKRPLVRAEIENRMVLLKGYSVGVDTEENVVERAAKYKQVWSSLKDDSGLMELICLFFCKADPLVYLIVPFYPEESLGAVQAKNTLTSHETLKVMSGVAHGLQILHAAGIIVGALHENNVFAVNREKGIIGDFDFTRDANQRSSITMVGFPHVTAPELKLGHTATESSDMYAYGCLLLWLSLGDAKITRKQDGTPDLSQLTLDPKVKSLLSGLLCCGDRLRAEEVKAHEYFQEASILCSTTSDELGENTPADFA